MENRNYGQERLRTTHLIILTCFTVLTLLLIGESLLLGWEVWSIPIWIFGVIACWTVHFTQKLPGNARLWVYASIMMLAFFFYGIHETSTFDLAPVMAVVIMIYSMAGQIGLINLCLCTYYLTMAYEFFAGMARGMTFTALGVTRSLLHLALVFLAGRMAKLIISGRNREQGRFIRTITELEEMNRRTEDFLTNVSHELRTPINAVTGISALILKKEKNLEIQKDVLAVQKAGHRLFDQISNILDYTEIDTGKLVVTEENYMLSSVVNDIAENIRAFSQDAFSPEIIFDVDPEIPSILSGDGRKVKKILAEIINNAMKFTQEGGIRVKVSALPRDYGVNLRIDVSDTGIGMSAEELGRVSESFYQTHGGADRRAGGLGLGLPIVYGLTKALGGFMHIESAKGTGTTVHISLPQKIVDAQPCMIVEKDKEFSLACFLRPEKYKTPAVRDYYNELISSLAKGLGLIVHRVSTIEDLEKVADRYRLTHLFIGQEEYESDPAYFEALTKKMLVIAAVRGDFALREKSALRILRKPVCGFPVTELLNIGKDDRTTRAAAAEKRMVCPGVRVLVVDDEPMNLMVAEGIFGEYRMEVTTAGGGREALRICEEEDFDIIFLDHMMPEMDGIETIKELRKLPVKEGGTDALIVALTANAVSGAREMFFREGFDEFVSKPIETMELERVLRKILPKTRVEFIGEDEEEPEASAEAAEASPESRAFTALGAEGIDVEAGVRYCANDKAFYMELVRKFAADEEGKRADIEESFAKEDWETYRIRVHALKSTSKMIGATALSEFAAGLEDAAKKGDAAYIKARGEELSVKYKELRRIILTAIGETESGEMESAGDGAGETEQEIGDTLLKQRLGELKQVLSTFEADRAEEMLGELAGFKFNGKPLAEALAPVREGVENFDMKAAEDALDALLAGIA